MRVEVLRQAVDEERLLFPSQAPSAALDRLGRDHTMLHLITEALAAAATDEGSHLPADLAATTPDLLAHLERHLSNEEVVLVASEASDETPGTTALTGRPHEWFVLSEDGMLELDRCPPAGSSTPSWTGWCGCAAANGSNCAPAGTRPRSSSGWTASVPGTTVSTTCRTARTGGVSRSPAVRRRDQRRLS
jgi:hypothetical protein